MKIFLDANLILDLLLKRSQDGFFDEMLKILEIRKQGKISLYCTSTSFFFIDFMLSKAFDVEQATKYQKEILSVIHAEPTFHDDLIKGLNSSIKDKEDSFQYFSAQHLNGLRYFLTGNIKEYPAQMEDLVKVITPKTFLDLYLNES